MFVIQRVGHFSLSSTRARGAGLLFDILKAKKSPSTRGLKRSVWQQEKQRQLAADWQSVLSVVANKTNVVFHAFSWQIVAHYTRAFRHCKR
jgi:hypothetical protein